jgi:hypothetical protein
MADIGETGRISVYIAPPSAWDAVTSWGSTHNKHWDGTNGYNFTKLKHRLWVSGNLNKTEEFELLLTGINNSAHTSSKPLWYNNIVLIFSGVISTAGGSGTGKIILKGYIDSIKFTSRDECTVKGYRSLEDLTGVQIGKRAMTQDMRSYGSTLQNMFDKDYLNKLFPYISGESGGAVDV